MCAVLPVDPDTLLWELSACLSVCRYWRRHTLTPPPCGCASPRRTPTGSAQGGVAVVVVTSTPRGPREGSSSRGRPCPKQKAEQTPRRYTGESHTSTSNPLVLRETHLVLLKQDRDTCVSFLTMFLSRVAGGQTPARLSPLSPLSPVQLGGRKRAGLLT